MVDKHNDYQTFRIDLNGQTIVIVVYKNRLPQMIYWGKKLPQDENLTHLAVAADHNTPLGHLSEMSRVSFAPQLGWGFKGYPGLELADQDGSVFYTQFKFMDFHSERHADRVDFEFTSVFTHKHLKKGLDKKMKLIHRFTWHTTNMLVAYNRIENEGDEIIVNWLPAPVMEIAYEVNKAQFWHGKWIKEFQKEEVTVVSNSVILRENRRGRTSHEVVPAVIFPFPEATQTGGRALGFYLGWSGNHRLVVERLNTGTMQLQMGSLEEGGEVRLKAGESFTSPPLYGCYSELGINGIRKAFHYHLRSKILSHSPLTSPRKVHCNSWEAVYFNHDLEKLKRLVDAAAEVGAERFVLDDGWFGERNNDMTSLGDWEVDRGKYPDDLFPLIDYVISKGLDFGLWLEPEMINEQSQLYREHPNWVLHPSGLERIVGRYQLVLDLTNPDVFDYLYERVSAIIEKYHLAYIKWDHNRVLISKKTRRQTEALYRLWEKLKKHYPQVELESCASGGGRIDLGIVNWADRFWLSDSNDPVERWRMQFEAGIFFPPELIGSHVGPRECHTSNRITPIQFRGLVAVGSHFGYECDLTELTPEEKNELKEITAYYKQHRDFFHTADLFALNDKKDDQYSLVYIAPDKSKFILFVGVLGSEDTTGSPMIQLTGLNEKIHYAVEEKFGSAVKSKLNFKSTLFLKDGGDLENKGLFTLTGKSLMRVGFRLPVSMPLTMWVFEGRSINIDKE